MTDRDMWAATMVGAAIGGVTAFLFFTDRGRHLRRQFETGIEDFVHEVVQFRGTVRRATGVAAEGWHVLSDLLGEPAPHSTSPYHGGQSAPF